MTASQKLFIRAMDLVPKKSLSRGVRRLAQVPSKAAIRRFAQRYGVAVEEAEHPLDHYQTLLDFFTRRLKTGLRPIDPDPDAIVCPVDGVIDASGKIERGKLLQAKGRLYSLAALLAGEERAARYTGGSFATLYLSPKDYHRIHSPEAGRVAGSTYVPGALYPVNPAAVANVDSLFATNERLITHLETERFGGIEVVMVGATCVGHIKVSYDADIATNCGGASIERKTYDPAPAVERGAELGVFEMGSTVILVTEKNVALQPLAPKTPVRVGMCLGRRVQ